MDNHYLEDKDKWYIKSENDDDIKLFERIAHEPTYCGWLVNGRQLLGSIENNMQQKMKRDNG